MAKLDQVKITVEQSKINLDEEGEVQVEMDIECEKVYFWEPRYGSDDRLRLSLEREEAEKLRDFLCEWLG